MNEIIAKLNQEKIVQTFLALVPIDNAALHERAMADELLRRLRGLGLVPHEDETYRRTGGDAGNIFVRVPGGLDLPPLLFSAHLDSVAPACGKKAIVHDDGRITSDGTTVLGADDLAGLTEILSALELYLEVPVAERRPLELLFTYAEELYDVGSEFFDFTQIAARESYVLDASGPLGTYLYQAPSIISFDVQIKGRAAHAGFTPEAGIHAIRIAAEAIAALDLGHVAPNTTANVGEIHGGTNTNNVPESCRVTGEVRSYDHELALAQIEKIRATFATAAQRYGGEITFTTRIGCRAYRTPGKALAIKRFESACHATDLTPRPEASFGGSDQNRLTQHGLTGIVLACGMTDCHSVHEYITESDLLAATRLVLALMLSRE